MLRVRKNEVDVALQDVIDGFPIGPGALECHMGTAGLHQPRGAAEDPPVIVLKVRCSSRRVPRGPDRTRHAVTCFLWTSSPQHRSYRTFIENLRSAAARAPWIRKSFPHVLSMWR